ncbi:MAG: ATP-binding cassette domain-containing protein [Rhizobiales bacterium]|nr:ATP-binding cassette domain-containing protein [Hyphomicrobiales bacterium]
MTNLFERIEQLTDPFPLEEPVKPPQGLFAFIRHYAWPFRWLLLTSAVLAAVIAVLEVLVFSFVGDIIDWLNTGRREDFWQAHADVLMAMGVLVVIILPLLKFSYETVVHQGLLGNFAMANRWRAHRYVLRQSMSFFQNDFAGRIATKVMQSAIAVRETVMKLMDVMVYVLVYFTAALVMFAASDIRLSAPLFGWLACYGLVLRHYVPRLAKVSQEQSEARSVVTGRIVDSYTNIATVKMFAHADREDRYAHGGMTRFLETVNRQMRQVTWMVTILAIMNSLLVFSVGALGIWLWQIEAVTAGAVAFSLGLVIRLQGMSQWILWEVAAIFENIGVIQDGIETISRDRAVVDRPSAPALVVRQGAIRYEAVTFHYGKEKGVIEDFTLDIRPGEKVGLVGRSGAGKSTVVNLLLRFHDVERGRILIDGQDIAAVSQESLRANIGMVTQDTSLLHRSVLANLVYGRQGATLEEAMAAARKAHAHEFIEKLEDLKGRTGYGAHVGERGVKLSGGQRQRIAIARVLLKDAPILVLDEATSALDSEVEAAIQEQLYNLMAGKTVIAIAHRLSTIAAMDRLVVMDAGRIVEQGTHEELISGGGLYASLWQRQSGGFLDLGAEAAQ